MSQEQRSAFRIQLPDGQKGASLRFDGRSYDVQLLDASAAGVAIACPLSCPIEIDQTCELHTSSGGGILRIVRKEVVAGGILLGAERIGDLKDNSRSLLGTAQTVALLPLQILSGCNLPTRIGLLTAAAVAIVGGFIYWNPINETPASPEMPIQPVKHVVEHTPSPEPVPSPSEVQEALRQVNEALAELAPEPSASDLRAQRIFAQQKLLLSPEYVQKLRLTPTQESRIQRAIAPAEEAASDIQDPQFWEAIRHAEIQILTILSPAQVKAWRAQNGA